MFLLRRIASAVVLVFLVASGAQLLAQAAAGDFAAAAAFAKDAAPYLHPRLSAVAVGGPDGQAVPLGICFVNSPPCDGEGG